MNSSTLQDSDSSDEDYLPDKKSEEILSEEDSDGESEGDTSLDNQNNSKGRKRSKSALKSRKKQKKVDNESSVSEPLTVENRKKIEEDVWADFIKDTGFQAKGKPSESYDKSKVNLTKSNDDGKLKGKTKVVVSEVVNFAGEDITVEKTISPGTSENRLPREASTSKSLKTTGRGTQRGIGGILSQLSGKSKINTLEKSKLDWDRFKREEKLEEELQSYNKGKAGYLERQDFLQRADLRRFEIEKEIRTVERSKRINDSM